jgi:uncharacterized protein YndB with AHSA1/START domain
MARPPHRLRPVGLDFLGTAPVRMAFSAVLVAPPQTVYHALADETRNWPTWFAGVRDARPHGDGGRLITLAGGMRFEETVLAADAPRRYAYRADSVNRAGLRALAEEWRIEPLAGASMVQWTVAADLSPAAAVLLRAFRPALRAALRRAAHRLDQAYAVPSRIDPR